MQKSFVLFNLIFHFALSGCSTTQESLGTTERIEPIPSSLFDTSTWVYQPIILQGNMVTQEQVNQLEIGMSRTQVRYILGTPTLQDVFHKNRWDYPYTKSLGSTLEESTHFTVYFEQDRLVEIEGDIQIQPESERQPQTRATVAKVPDQKREDTSFWSNFPRIFDF